VELLAISVAKYRFSVAK